MAEKLGVQLIHQNCLECSGGSRKCVIWCPCDGTNSTRCRFWPFRLGIKPSTLRAHYGDRLLTPEKMPPADIELDLLPGTLERAATAEISVDGYYQPTLKVERKPRRQLSSEDRQRLIGQLERFRKRLGRQKQRV